jgi:hypothetical protein
MSAPDDANNKRFRADAEFVWEDSERCKLLADFITDLVDKSLYRVGRRQRLKRRNFYEELKNFIDEFKAPDCTDLTSNRYISNMLHGVRKRTIKWPIPVLLKWLSCSHPSEADKFYNLSGLARERGFDVGKANGSANPSTIKGDAGGSAIDGTIEVREKPNVRSVPAAQVSTSAGSELSRWKPAEQTEDDRLMAPVFDEDKCYEIENRHATGVVRDARHEISAMYRAAYQGNDRAMFDLCCCIMTGRHFLKVDFLRAVYWQRKSADLGNTAAMTGMGVSYFKGMGVDQDFDQARYWWDKASEAGDKMADRYIEALNRQLAASAEYLLKARESDHG